MGTLPTHHRHLPRTQRLTARARTTLLLACASASTFSVPGKASPSDLFGTGSKSQATGGTGVADGEGPTAVHLNPALLGGTVEKRLRAGMLTSRFRLHATEATGRSEYNDSVGAGQFGLSFPLRLAEPFDRRIGFGLHLSTPGGVIARVRLLDPAHAGFPLLADRAETMNLDVGFGVQLPHDIRIGAGVMLLASLTGTIAIEAGAGGSVTSQVDDELTLTRAAVLGATMRTGSVRWGAVYRGELRSEFDLRVSLEDLGGIVLPPLRIAGIAQYDPEQVQLEASWQPEDWQLSAAVTYKNWPRLRRLSVPTIVCPSDRADACAPARDLELDSTWVPRLGAEKRFALTRSATGQLRGGYFYEPSPVPTWSGREGIWDNDRHALTLGYSVRWGPAPRSSPEWEAAFSLQHHWLVPRDHPARQGTQRDAGALTTTGRVLVAGVDLEVPF